MVTTTSTTSTTTATAATTTTTAAKNTSSVVSSAAQGVLTSLNAGSGIDTSSLVTSLVEAQYATKTSTLSAKSDKLTAQISGVSTLKSALTTFNTALQSLVKGGTLTSQPVSSNSGVLSATAQAGAKLAGLSASLTVSQLAAPQTAVSATAFASSTASVGTGTLTLTFGEATYASDGSAMTGFTPGTAAPVTIAITDGGLDKIAASINNAKAGVTATVVSDADGKAYLSLKGATGKAQAFTLSATSDTGDLSQLAVGDGATNTRLTSTAQNARLSLDGVSVERASNTVSDLISGVDLKLTGTSVAPVSLTSTTPTEALSNAVTDFVDTYNEVMKLVTEQLDPVTGPLRGDTGAEAVRTAMRGLTQTTLIAGSAGSPTTLAGIGVRTNRDGTLEVDADSLASAIKNTPDAVEAMFAFSSNGETGVSAKLNAVWLRTTSTIYGLGASTSRYLAAQADVSDEQADMETAKATTTARMTQQFSAMSSRVAAYKSVQTFLTNQIAAWNKSDD